jgi:gamma-resorcylate decarboxylase
MDLANVSVSVVTIGYPEIQGIFNTSFAIEIAKGVDDQLAANYSRGNYSDRFEFFCQVVL